MSREQKNLENLFFPKSIAIIGASRDPKKVGGAVLKNLIKSGYKGKIFAVNPNAEKIQGIKSYKNIREIDLKIDLAVIIVSAPLAAQILKECGESNIKAAAVISSGFKEAGEEGKKREDEIAEIAREYNITLLGPNCLGIINTSANLNASFASSYPQKGRIAIISQSGAIISSLIDWGNENNLGFSKVASLGNKAVLDESDILEYLEKDKATRVVGLYIENISEAGRFASAARKAGLKKPVVIFKSGTSKAGQSASQSHTGALATEDRITGAIIKKSGAIRAGSLKEFLEVLRMFNFSADAPKEIFAVSNAGGLAVAAADKIESSRNLRFAELSLSAKEKIKTILPPFLSAKNPLDIGGDAGSERYEKIFSALNCGNKNFSSSAIIAIITPQAMTECENIAKAIFRLSRKMRIIPVLSGGKKMEKSREILKKAGIPFYDFPEDAVRILDIAAQKSNSARKDIEPENFHFLQKNEFNQIKIILSSCPEEGWISLDRTLKIAELAGIPIAKSFVCDNINELNRIAEKMVYPAFIKTAAGNIVHKAKAKQAIGDIPDKKKLIDSFMKIQKPAIIQSQEKKDLELFVGAKRIRGVGEFLTLGIGGTFANEFNQAEFYMLPFSAEEARGAIEDSPFAKILTANLKKDLIKIILSIQRLLLSFENISEIDLNPVLANLNSETLICPDVKIHICHISSL